MDFYNDDPNLELEEIAWFHILGECMQHTYKNVRSSQKLIKLKKGRDPLIDEDEHMSCYVELHRTSLIFLEIENAIFVDVPYSFYNPDKPSGWFKWPKSHSCLSSIQVFTYRRIWETSEVREARRLDSKSIDGSTKTFQSGVKTKERKEEK